MMRLTIPALLVLGIGTSGAVPLVRAQSAAPIFRFEADGFWLNLHHFLYVLGRADAKMPDAGRRAVAGASADQSTGMATLSQVEQQAWAGVVRAYAGGQSQKDAVFDRDLVALTAALQRIGGDAPASAAKIDPRVTAVLDRAAPIYRKVWWAAHQTANRAQVAELQGLVDRHGAAVLKYVTRAYQQPWPAGGVPVNVSAYSNWAGAYSTGDQLLVVSSLDPGTKGLRGMEIVFHEAMHQWDDSMYARLRKVASQQGTSAVDENMTHAMIFYTAGEAVRSVVADHTPYAEGSGLWRQKGLGGFKAALDRSWKPYLDGKGPLDEAIAALLKP